MLPSAVTTMSVSIHASAREATSRSCSPGLVIQFQSTPPRGRRLSYTSTTVPNSIVSIHASAREATDSNSWTVMPKCVSIHASAREATLPSQCLCCRC